VTQFGCGKNEQLPAPKPGGRYKINRHWGGRFCRGLSVPFKVNRVFRDGEGTFLSKQTHHPNSADGLPGCDGKYLVH